MRPPLPEWAGPQWAPLGPNQPPPWALMSRALLAPLGPHGRGPIGPPGQSWAPLAPNAPGLNGRPWVIKFGALKGRLGPHGLDPKWLPPGPLSAVPDWSKEVKSKVYKQQSIGQSSDHECLQMRYDKVGNVIGLT